MMNELEGGHSVPWWKGKKGGGGWGRGKGGGSGGVLVAEEESSVVLLTPNPHQHHPLLLLRKRAFWNPFLRKAATIAIIHQSIQQHCCHPKCIRSGGSAAAFKPLRFHSIARSAKISWSKLVDRVRGGRTFWQSNTIYWFCETQSLNGGMLMLSRVGRSGWRGVKQDRALLMQCSAASLFRVSRAKNVFDDFTKNQNNFLSVLSKIILANKLNFFFLKHLVVMNIWCSATWRHMQVNSPASVVTSLKEKGALWWKRYSWANLYFLWSKILPTSLTNSIYRRRLEVI